MTLPVNTYNASVKEIAPYVPGNEGFRIHAPNQLGALLAFYDGFGLGCSTIENVFEGRRYFLSVPDSYVRTAAPGASFHTSEVQFVPPAGFTGQVQIQMYYVLATGGAGPLDWGLFTVDAVNGVVTNVQDGIGRQITFTADSTTDPDAPDGTYGIDLSYPGWDIYVAKTGPMVDDFTQAYMDFFVPRCAVNPPEPPAPPPPPQLTKLPKFANFSQFVNPFGFQKGN